MTGEVRDRYKYQKPAFESDQTTPESIITAQNSPIRDESRAQFDAQIYAMIPDLERSSEMSRKGTSNDDGLQRHNGPRSLNTEVTQNTDSDTRHHTVGSSQSSISSMHLSREDVKGPTADLQRSIEASLTSKKTLRHKQLFGVFSRYESFSCNTPECQYTHGQNRFNNEQEKSVVDRTLDPPNVQEAYPRTDSADQTKHTNSALDTISRSPQISTTSKVLQRMLQGLQHSQIEIVTEEEQLRIKELVQEQVDCGLFTVATWHTVSAELRYRYNIEQHASIIRVFWERHGRSRFNLDERNIRSPQKTNISERNSDTQRDIRREQQRAFPIYGPLIYRGTTSKTRTHKNERRLPFTEPRRATECLLKGSRGVAEITVTKYVTATVASSADDESDLSELSDVPTDFEDQQRRE
ncbi:MAG: hypothetical protein Q9190_005625 [Brigantiaea leucoxantha]